MAKDLNLKTDKLFLITVITSWSLEFKVTNPNTDIISSFDSRSLVNSGKGCYVWIKLDEMKTDILFEPVWQRKWKLQNQAVKLTFKAQALWLEGVCVVFLAILCFIGKPLQGLAVHSSLSRALCSRVRRLRPTLWNCRQLVFSSFQSIMRCRCGLVFVFSLTVMQLSLKCGFWLSKCGSLSIMRSLTLLCL